MLFVSSAVLPAGLAAANLHCDMEMSHATPACCAAEARDEHHEEKQETQACQQEAFCAQAVVSSPSDIPAVTLSSKIAFAAKLLEELPILQNDSDARTPAGNESVSLYNHPPIFLLTSAFLN